MSCVLTASVEHNNGSFAFIQLAKRSHPLQIICITNCCAHSASSVWVVCISPTLPFTTWFYQFSTWPWIWSYCHTGNIHDSKIKSLCYQKD